MAILSRYTVACACIPFILLPSSISAHPGESPQGLTERIQTQEAKANRALYEFEYVQWVNRRPRVEPQPVSDTIREHLLRLGNSAEDIERYEDYRKLARTREAGEHWERGTVTVRRLGNVVSVEKRQEEIRYAGEEWRAVGQIRKESYDAIHLKGVKLPAGHSESVIRDYSNGSLTSTVGRIGPSGRIDEDVDRGSGYSFPSTIGGGPLAIPLAGLPVSMFCPLDLFSAQDHDLAWAQRDQMRRGHRIQQTFEVSMNTGKLSTFTESVDKKPYLTVVVGEYQPVNGGLLVPKHVDVKFLAGPQSTPNQQVSYELKRTEFGDRVDVKDMESMGPVGVQVLDDRLKGPKAVPYAAGKVPKTDAEVRHIAGDAFAHDLPENNRPTQLMFIGSGVLMVFGAATWVFRSRKRP